MANEPAKRIALLIDADNAPAGKIDVILAEVARHGEANVRRAYGNWKNPHIKGWEETLHAHAIRPIQQFAYSTGKNASDMAMVIDAMDLLYAGSVERIKEEQRKREIQLEQSTSRDEHSAQ